MRKKTPCLCLLKHFDQLVSNIIIRLQVQKILNNGNADNKYKNYYLRAISRPIKAFSNKYQCLLEQQSHFLLDSSCWWSETDEGVVFLGYSETGRNLDTETHVTLHHW